MATADSYVQLVTLIPITIVPAARKFYLRNDTSNYERYLYNLIVYRNRNNRVILPVLSVRVHHSTNFISSGYRSCLQTTRTHEPREFYVRVCVCVIHGVLENDTTCRKKKFFFFFNFVVASTARSLATTAPLDV